MRLSLVIVLAVAITHTTHGQAPAKVQGVPLHSDIDDTSRFIFYSVLEGLYEDGLSNEDVNQILMKKENQSYFHFIYSCPICGPTIWALEAYRSRPERFYGLKKVGSTFGHGLPDSLHQKLYSEDSNQRLIAINTLVMKWISRRMNTMHLSDEDRANLLKALEQKRKAGMEALESFRRLEHGPDFGVAQAAPAYVDLEECAVCNGAVGKVMKLSSTKEK